MFSWNYLLNIVFFVFIIFIVIYWKAICLKIYKKLFSLIYLMLDLLYVIYQMDSKLFFLFEVCPYLLDYSKNFLFVRQSQIIWNNKMITKESDRRSLSYLSKISSKKIGLEETIISNFFRNVYFMYFAVLSVPFTFSR